MTEGAGPLPSAGPGASCLEGLPPSVQAPGGFPMVPPWSRPQGEIVRGKLPGPPWSRQCGPATPVGQFGTWPLRQTPGQALKPEPEIAFAVGRGDCAGSNASRH